jgi:crotonobetainyl-CoA:carnitine CoA-transferase CaiB-like acyl-CoA transferase
LELLVMGNLPLEGIKVLELAHIVAGPAAGLILADMGADVVKIEPPDALEPQRIGTARVGQFFFFNRNKRSLVLDLKKEEGRRIFFRLAERADVVVDNMGPQTMERLGIGYEQVSPRNPRIIYCSVKGFLTGPYSERPFLDELAQMMCGLAYMTGPPGLPLRAGASVVDIGAATYAVVGVLGALLKRQATGRGQKITGGLFETGLFLVGQHMANSQFSGQAPIPMPARDQQASRQTGWGVYDLFDCADGRRVFIGVTSDAQWKRFCQALGLDDLARDPELATNPGRRERRPTLVLRIGQAVAAMDSGHLADLMARNGVPVAPLHTPEDVLEDPHVKSDGRLLRVRGVGHDMSLPPLPYESSEYPFTKRVDPPGRPGEHTREVLAEAGYSAERIGELLRDQVVKEL